MNVEKQDPSIYCQQETHLRSKDTYKLKVKGWKRGSMHIEAKKKKGQVAIFISDKIFKTSLNILFMYLLETAHVCKSRGKGRGRRKEKRRYFFR